MREMALGSTRNSGTQGRNDIEFPNTSPVLIQTHRTTEIELLPQYFEQACDRRPDWIAVICGPTRITYLELDHRANRLAHLLLERGIEEGEPVGILLERSPDMYVALLGVLKAGAAYVPLDPSFPADRMAFIAKDAGLRDLVTTSAFREQTRALACPVLELDEAEAKLAAQSKRRSELNVAPSSPCYIIYTSGSTGQPKGVAVSHASIVNFLRVATPIYNVTSEDLVYQGMTISFDFHIEEIWPAWVTGATLIAGPTDSRRFGQGLTDFLNEHKVTVFCSVPTLLATIDADVPSLRCMLSSGEAMPADLVRRWSRPRRRILNCYGPTETTITATVCELLPDRPVTLGTPLPTYRVYILNEQLRPVEEGGSGEICIGGPGVAIGYLHRPDLTAERFVPNPLSHEQAEAPRIYRTGDLGRFTSSGEIEYLGRIDTQVKIRGYRIELGEIEEVLRQDQAVKNAVVTPLERDGVVQDLVGYITLHNHEAHAADPDLRQRLHATLRRRLPTYMIPSFIEVLNSFPLLAADKVNRAALPAPASPPLGLRSTPHVPAVTPLEGQLAEVWGQVLGSANVSVEDDFFCDLGGHSLAAARLISRLRQQPELRGLAIGDLYAHPTIRSLARFIEVDLAAPAEELSIVSVRPAPRRHSSKRVLGCGLAQLVALYGWMLLLSVPALGLLYAVLFLIGLPVTKVFAAVGILAHPSILVLLAIAFIWVVWFAATLFLLPVVGGHVLMRGVRPGWYPLWGATYLRWWFYGKVLALSPVGLLAGSPLLPPYLRLLGARVGRDCHLSSGSVIGMPIFVDIGEGVSIGYGARVQPFFMEGGWLRLAPIRLGSGSFIGTNSIVLAGAEIGSQASVGEMSLVPADHVIPASEHWAGSPIKRLQTAPSLLEAMDAKADGRRWPVSVLAGYIVGALLLMLLPLLMLAPSAVLVGVVTIRAGIAWGMASTALAGPLYVLVTCILVLVIKHTVLPAEHSGIYPERSGFGLRKWLSDKMMNISLVMTHTLYATLYLVPFLRLLGARTGRWSEVAAVSFVDPNMLIDGEQSFVAENTVMAPPVFHRGCIAIAPVQVGRRSFVGNGALVPGSCQLADNSLLGVQSVPSSRSIDPETTWLGSPAIFLPRRQASERFPEELTFRPRPSLIAWRLGFEFFRVTLPATILGLAMLVDIYVTIQLITLLSPLALLVIMPVLIVGMGVACYLLVVLLKWLFIGRYRPRAEPLWSIWVRRTEFITGLYESVAVPALVNFLTATPWIAPVLRLLGARIGRRVMLATTWLTEFDLVEVGDDVAVGEATSLQTHLFEDRVMKMSMVRVGTASTVGSRSIVLYDSQVGSGATLDSLTLVMKGESLPPESRWRGIPARPI